MFSDMHTENIMASVILPHHKQVGIRRFLPNGFISKVLDYQFMPMGFGIWCEGRNLTDSQSILLVGWTEIQSEIN